MGGVERWRPGAAAHAEADNAGAAPAAEELNIDALDLQELLRRFEGGAGAAGGGGAHTAQGAFSFQPDSMNDILKSLYEDIESEGGAGVRLPVPAGAEKIPDSDDVSELSDADGSVSSDSASSRAFAAMAAAVGGERWQGTEAGAASDDEAAAEYDSALREELKGHGVEVAAGDEAPVTVQAEAVRDLLRSVAAEHPGEPGAARALLAAQGMAMPSNVDPS